MDESRAIETRLREAQGFEKEDPARAIVIYRECAEAIKAIDATGAQAAASRRVAYPINRLSMTLERNAQKREARTEIEL